jgi:hypothetical protein
MDKFYSMMLWVRMRLRETSTRMAIVSLLATIGFNVDPALFDQYGTIIYLILGAAGFFVKDVAPLTKVDK